jgi:hypothetical protein
MKERERWLADLVELGCIVCLNEYGLKSPPDIHHIHKNSRRVSDLHTIPLCYYHHRAGLNNDTYASRHPWKKEFEKRYGSEWDLWERTKELVEEQRLNAQITYDRKRYTRLNAQVTTQQADPLGE